MCREADKRMPLASRRAEHQAHKDQVVLLREQVAALEHQLRRARRCLAAERTAREALCSRVSDMERTYAFAVGTLARLAFPKDLQP